MVGTVGSTRAEGSTPGGRARCMLWSPGPERQQAGQRKVEQRGDASWVTPGGSGPSVLRGCPHRGHCIPALRKLLSLLSPLLMNWVLAGKLIL